MSSMDKITIYTPVVEDIDGCFTVDGANDPDRDFAIRKTLRHSVFRTKGSTAKILRVDETEVYKDHFYRPPL